MQYIETTSRALPCHVRPCNAVRSYIKSNIAKPCQAMQCQPKHAMQCGTQLSNVAKNSPVHCHAGDLRGQGLGMHTASTSSLQYAHEENMNGIAAIPHSAHAQTASVADSADETAHTAGVLFTAMSSRMQHDDRQLQLAKCWPAVFTAGLI